MIPHLNKLKKELNEKILSLKPVELFSGPTNATTINLKDSITNYKYVEIFYSMGTANGALKSSKAPVGPAINLSDAISGYFDNSYYGIRLHATSCIISGTTLTKQVGYNFSFKTDNTMVFDDTKNEIYIHEVIGYK